MSTTRAINFMSNNSDSQELHNHNENHNVSIAIKILKDDMSSLMDIDKLSICSILAARSKMSLQNVNTAPVLSRNICSRRSD